VPYPRHWLFVMGGNLTGSAPNEIWECTIRGVPAAGSTHTYGDEDAVLAAIAPAMDDWYSDGEHHLSQYSSLAYLKLNEIAPDGTYADPGASHRYDYAVPVAGTDNAATPTFVSACLSWRTARARGIASHGRIYPVWGIAMSQTDRLTETQQTNFLNAGFDLLNAVSEPSTGDFEFAPCVVSKGANNGAGAGRVEAITRVLVGDVYDVQRRRKNALPETYASMDWP